MSDDKKIAIPYIMITPATIMMVSFVVVPLILSFVLGWYSWSPLRPGGPIFVGAKNYIKLFHNEAFFNTIKVSLKYVLIVTSVSTTLGFLIAMALSVNMTGIGVVRGIVTLPLMISPVVVGLTWVFLYKPAGGIINYILNLLNLGWRPIWLSDPRLALISVSIVRIWQQTPFAVLIFLARFLSLPIEPYEAAKVEGASKWAIFRYLTIPLSYKHIMLVILFLSVDAMREFDIIYTMTRGGPGRVTEVSSLYAYNLGFKVYEMGQTYAMTHVILLLTLLLAVFILIFWKRLD
jgi:multiple sugar transport system permease protein